jgi:hypothetical protein
VLAGAEHLRRRTQRLELATRFRPIHIECLILYSAPPVRMEDYFYKAAQNGNERGAESRAFFDALLAAAGVEATPGKDEETLLEEFQRKGSYLAACCECPLEEAGIAEEKVADLFADDVVKRIKFSYRPKRVVLVSRELKALAGHLRAAGLAEGLLQNEGEPVELPLRYDAGTGAEFASRLRSIIRESTIP